MDSKKTAAKNEQTKAPEIPVETADTQTNPDVVEAAGSAPAETGSGEAKGETKPKKGKGGDNFVMYKSADEEASAYEIQIKGELLRPSWDGGRKHLYWKCPAELAEWFEKHYHFVTGRVVRAND
jgi:hypothetical protein